MCADVAEIVPQAPRRPSALARLPLGQLPPPAQVPIQAHQQQCDEPHHGQPALQPTGLKRGLLPVEHKAGGQANQYVKDVAPARRHPPHVASGQPAQRPPKQPPLQEVRPQFLRTHGRQLPERHIKRGDRPGLPAGGLPGHCPREGHEHRPRELGIRPKFEAERDCGGDVVVRHPRADHLAAVRHAGVVGGEFGGGEEGDGGVVVGEVVRHLNDGALDGGAVGALLGHHVARALVHGARGEVDVAVLLDRRDRRLDGDRVLLGVNDAGDAADRVRMPLRDTGPPERGGGTGGEDGVAEHAQHREQARVPAGGDQGEGAGGAGGVVERGEVGGDVGVGVEGVDRVEQRGDGGALNGEVRGGAAAVHDDVEPAHVLLHAVHVHDRRAEGGDGGGVAASEDDDALHARLAAERQLDAAAQIAVPVDAYTNHELLFRW